MVVVVVVDEILVMVRTLTEVVTAVFGYLTTINLYSGSRSSCSLHGPSQHVTFPLKLIPMASISYIAISIMLTFSFHHPGEGNKKENAGVYSFVYNLINNSRLSFRGLLLPSAGF